MPLAVCTTVSVYGPAAARLLGRQVRGFLAFQLMRTPAPPAFTGGPPALHAVTKTNVFETVPEGGLGAAL